MKKAILSLLLMTCLSKQAFFAQVETPAAMEQPEKGGRKLSIDERLKRETEKATKKLGLSQDQQIKWQAACQERLLSNAPLREKLKGSTTPEERKNLQGQLKVNNKKFDTAVLSFLSVEQKSSYETFKSEKKKKNAEKGKKSAD